MLKSNKKKTLRKLVVLSVLLPTLSLSHVNAATDNDINASALPSNNKTISAKEKLMKKLSKLAFFTANFSQNIRSESGELLSQGTGNLAISKPNLVHWQTLTPDETQIVSDGNTLWFYDPFIEQASAYSLAKSIHNTPILLLTTDEASLWQQYNVQEEISDDEAVNVKPTQRFVIQPIDTSSQIKQLTLTFTVADVAGPSDTELSQFSFQDATGQVSEITLNNFNSKTKPQASLFSFSLPEGVRLEDQR
jgi:outer membrane lipoprotein carrier protein